jgi:hypothetical protein
VAAFAVMVVDNVGRGVYVGQGVAVAAIGVIVGGNVGVAVFTDAGDPQPEINKMTASMARIWVDLDWFIFLYSLTKFGYYLPIYTFRGRKSPQLIMEK